MFAVVSYDLRHDLLLCVDVGLRLSYNAPLVMSKKGIVQFAEL